MNEVIVNTNEIESCWEKDNLCFVKMRSGKVWLCQQSFAVDWYFNSIHQNSCDTISDGTFDGHNDTFVCITKLLISNSSGFITLPLSKGKCDR